MSRGYKPIDPSATQLVLENNWPRVPVEQSGEASDMMRAGSLPARRRFELIRLAQRQGQLSVAELSSQFGVSADTIRRDLDLLSMGGFVRRTHGGERSRRIILSRAGLRPPNGTVRELQRRRASRNARLN